MVSSSVAGSWNLVVSALRAWLACSLSCGVALSARRPYKSPKAMTAMLWAATLAPLETMSISSGTWQLVHSAENRRQGALFIQPFQEFDAVIGSEPQQSHDRGHPYIAVIEALSVAAIPPGLAIGNMHQFLDTRGIGDLAQQLRGPAALRRLRLVPAVQTPRERRRNRIGHPLQVVPHLFLVVWRQGEISLGRFGHAARRQEDLFVISRVHPVHDDAQQLV